MPETGLAIGISVCLSTRYKKNKLVNKMLGSDDNKMFDLGSDDTLFIYLKHLYATFPPSFDDNFFSAPSACTKSVWH